MFMHCIRSLHFLKDVSDIFFFDSVQQYILVYVRYMSLDIFPMYLHCIRSLRFFESCCFFLSHKQASLVYICYMSWDGFPMFLHCIRSLHFLKVVSDLFFFDSVQLYILVYVRYMSWDVFPMYLHCIRSLRFFDSCCIFLTQTGISCLQPLHVMGWFSYVFALYTFVTLFERCI